MEKKVARGSRVRGAASTTKERLLDAGLAVLGEGGAGALAVRAVEERAGVPHGSVRHHFGDRRGLVLALVEHARAVEARALEGMDIAGAIVHWTGPGRTVLLARYELGLLAARDPEVREAFVAARDAFVERAGGGQAGRRAVAVVDGLILDALIRGRADPGELRAAVAAALS